MKLFFIRPSLLASIVLIMSCILNYNKLSWHISFREISIYLFMATLFMVSYFFGIGVDEDNWFYLEKMLKLSIFLFFFFRVVHTKTHLNYVLWTIVAGGIFLCFTAYQYGGYYDGRLNNIGGTDFNEANGLATFLAVGLIFLGIQILHTRSIVKKGLLILPIPFILNVIIMSQSRAVFIGLAMGLAYIMLASPLAFKKELLLYAFLAVVLFMNLTHEKFWERMWTIEDQAGLMSQQDSLANAEAPISRMDYWVASIHIFQDYPMGIGVHNFQKLVPLYDPRNPGMDAHNTFVLIYSEAGIIGITLFLFILFKTYRKLSWIKKTARHSPDFQEYYMMGLCFSTILVMYFMGPNMTHSYLYKEFLWILLALPICLETAFRNQLIQQEKG